MDTKTQILHKLSAVAGAVSGQELANALGVSRAAVSKAVKALIKSGYNITAQTNKGYTLASGADIFTKEALCEAYKSGTVFFENATQSTNKIAKQLAANGAPHGTLFAAASQSGGRGRCGRAFYSPPATGVYFSVILRNLSIETAQLVTAAAAVSVLRVIKRLYGVSLSIKWVNDIFLNGKKVGGILTEAAFDMEAGVSDYAVVGIGLNIHTPKNGFPPEICNIASAILDADIPASRATICAEIATELLQIFESDAQFMPEYAAASCILGKKIKVMRSGNEKAATALGITQKGHLAVQYENGEKDTLYFGEVSVIN